MSETVLKIPQKLEKIASDIKSEGGVALLCGGTIPDLILGQDPRDWNVETYGVSIEILKNIVQKYGTLKVEWNKFSVIQMNIDGQAYDFSPAKIDYNEPLSDSTIKSLGKRRDLTINAIYYNLSDRRIIDPYHGIQDLETGILKHVSDSFTDDPTRVLRIMHLLPRKAKSVAPKTISVCRSMVKDYNQITIERAFGEWNKLLLGTTQPSIGLKFLVDSGWIENYPELDNLRGTKQNSDWHPEGDVWDHTLLVADNAAAIRHKVPPKWQAGFMFGSLLHDSGKPDTTDPIKLTSYGHETVGETVAQNFIKRITRKRRLIKQVGDITRCHMKPTQLYQDNSRVSRWKVLHEEVPLEILAYVVQADGAGTTNKTLTDPNLASERALELNHEFKKNSAKPILTGDHLINKGYPQGEQIGRMLRRAEEIQFDEGVKDVRDLLKKVTDEFPLERG